MRKPVTLVVLEPPAFVTTTVNEALFVATVGLTDPAVAVKVLVLVRAMPPGMLLRANARGKSVRFCPLVLVTVTTTGLVLLDPNWARLVATVKRGAAGRTVRLMVSVLVPAALVMISTTLVKIPAWVGLMPPITPTKRLVALVVNWTPVGRFEARNPMGKLLVFCPAEPTTTLTALALFVPNCSRLVLVTTLIVGTSGSTRSVRLVVRAPPLLVAVMRRLVTLVATVGLVLPITPTRPPPFVIRVQPPGRLAAEKETGKKLIFWPLVLVTVTSMPLVFSTSY